MAELKSRDGAAKKEAPAKKAPAEKKETEKKVTQAKPAGSAVGKRIGSVILWLLAIGFEIVCLMLLFGNLNLAFEKETNTIFGFVAMGLDLVCICIGSLLWKSANRIDPASKKNKVKFFLWNNMGLIVAIFAFVPLIVLLLRGKDKLDKKTRLIATVAAVIALLVGGLVSYDYTPVSQESKEEAITEIGPNTTVFWTKYGKVYHVDEDCQHINGSNDYYEGTVEEAIDNNRPRLCKTCAKNNNIEIEDIED